MTGLSTHVNSMTDAVVASAISYGSAFVTPLAIIVGLGILVAVAGVLVSMVKK